MQSDLEDHISNSPWINSNPPPPQKKKLMKINFAEYFVFDLQRWEYMHIPEPDSREAKLTEVLKNPKDWV